MACLISPLPLIGLWSSMKSTVAGNSPPFMAIQSCSSCWKASQIQSGYVHVHVSNAYTYGVVGPSMHVKENSVV